MLAHLKIMKNTPPPLGPQDCPRATPSRAEGCKSFDSWPNTLKIPKIPGNTWDLIRYTKIPDGLFFTWNKRLFGVFGQKKLMGWSDNFETFHNEKSGVLEKKPRKRKFYGGSPSCSNWVPKIWPITKQHTGLATLITISTVVWKIPFLGLFF